MTFTIRPAVREKIGLLFGVAGASGSGKTFSALTLAKGIANGTGRIGVIDTGRDARCIMRRRLARKPMASKRLIFCILIFSHPLRRSVTLRQFVPARKLAQP